MARQTWAAVVVSMVAVVTVSATDCGFLLTSPKVLLAGVDEDLCVSFHNITEDVTLTVNLNADLKTLHTQTETFPKGMGRCFPFQMLLSTPTGQHSLSVSGNAGDCLLTGETPVYVKNAKTSFIYIQTDKPVYKPGQNVQFRVLMLDLNLKPKDVMIPLVIIEDPSGSRMEQWTNVTTSRGLLSLDFQLATEPVLGEWKLKVSLLGAEQSQTFKVEEYVLPKYEVTVNMPHYVMVNAENIEFEVCARYTYGKPVRGTAKVILQVKQSYYRSSQRPVASRTTQINGCGKVSIPASEIELRSKKWSPWGATVEAAAVVTETATGISLNSSSTSKVEMNPININLKDGSDEHFKPGFPFRGRGTVTKPDGTPAPGEEIIINVNNKHRNKYTSDQNGHFMYTLPARKPNVVKFSVTATAPKYKAERRPMMLDLYEPHTYHEVLTWFSPSGSYIQVRLNNENVNCGEQLVANVSYSTNDSTNFRFFYQVISRGNIVLSDEKEHQFTHQSADRVKRSSLPIPPFPTHLEGPEPVIPQLPHIAHFQLTIPVSATMSPNPKLVIFYVRDDKETVADSVSFSVNKCLPNQVSLNTNQPQLLPGQRVSLTVGADPGSLCAVGVVDKSVHLLGGNNKLTKDKIFSSIKEYDITPENSPHIYDDYCDRQVRRPQPPPPPRGRGRFDPPGMPGPEPLRRQRRMIWPGGRGFSKYSDSATAFKDSGMVFVSNLEVATRPCSYRPLVYYSMAVVDDLDGVQNFPMLGAPGPMARGGQEAVPDLEIATPAASAPEENVVDLRTYFPETWLWQLVDMGTTNQQVLEEEMPHTITEWVGSAFCTNAQTGVGVSDLMKVKAFQPFFVSFTLPYSVIRKEKVPVLVTVFNYLSDCQVVELMLKNEPGFRFVGKERKTRLCVCGSESVSHTYYIVANTIGEVNITVEAVTVADEEVCGNDVTTTAETGARDAVTRTLLVEPEGREEEYSRGAFICPDKGKMDIQSFSLPVPDNVVADSVRGYVTVIGDVMGSSLSGLDSLLKMPTGCGEQNMLNFAPNIFVMQYLTQTGQLTPDIETKAKNFMKVGYQRELTYRHDDGSYSAFGKRDNSGSMWLTAFVVRSFAQARPFITIDEQDFAKSVHWFAQHQLENGCFPMVGRVIHKDMKGGLGSSRTPAALTAYVLISLLDAGVNIKEKTIQDAMLCLQSQDTSDLYTTALTAYAYTLYSHRDPKGQLLQARAIDSLIAMATVSDGTMHWGMPRAPHTPGMTVCGFSTPVSIDVEITSYALLALLGDQRGNILMKSLPIVKWLTQQRNAHGGFASTQDTVLALQSLAKYASLAYQDGIQIHSLVQGGFIDHDFFVDQHNKLVLQTETIDIPNNLTIQTSGQGCVLFQANVKFNVPLTRNHSETPAFDIRVSVPNRGVGSGKDACKKRMMSICTRYRGPGTESNMAIVAVKMVSGWIPDKDSIQLLKQDTRLGIKRIEIDHKWVNFYFDELTRKAKCIKFMIIQDMEVKNAKPAYIEVYDYYDKDLIVKEKYRLKRVCGTKNEIPHLTREEFEKAEKSGVIEQRRVPVEPVLIIEETITAGPGERCPACLTKIPADFATRFCSSKHAYRTDIHHRPARILSDHRPSTRETVNKPVIVSLPTGCSCDVLLSDTANKVLILTQSEAEATKSGQHSLSLLDTDTLIPLNRASTRQLKRHIRKAFRTSGCR